MSPTKMGRMRSKLNATKKIIIHLNFETDEHSLSNAILKNISSMLFRFYTFFATFNFFVDFKILNEFTCTHSAYTVLWSINRIYGWKIAVFGEHFWIKTKLFWTTQTIQERLHLLQDSYETWLGTHINKSA